MMVNRLSANRRSDAGAFTFIDFLMVCAGCALLVAIATPIILKSRSSSHQAQCNANLKQVTRAVLQFADENGGLLPAESPSPPKASYTGIWWWYKELVKGYLGLKDKSSPADRVFACPDDRGYEDPKPFWRNARFDYGSYNFNGVTIPGSPGVPNIAGRAVSSIGDPKRTLLMMEWTAHAPLSWHKSQTGSKNAPFYNDAESVVGFVDGHVECIRIYYDGMNAAYTRDPVSGYMYRYSGD